MGNKANHAQPIYQTVYNDLTSRIIRKKLNSLSSIVIARDYGINRNTALLRYRIVFSFLEEVQTESSVELWFQFDLRRGFNALSVRVFENTSVTATASRSG